MVREMSLVDPPVANRDNQNARIETHQRVNTAACLSGGPVGLHDGFAHACCALVRDEGCRSRHWPFRIDAYLIVAVSSARPEETDWRASSFGSTASGRANGGPRESTYRARAGEPAKLDS